MSATIAATQHSAPGGNSQPHALQTEFAFVLPRGYVDSNGTLHREGTMRLARARDEIYPQSDAKVRENPSYLTVILLTRTITKLGSLPEVDTFVVESLFASDLAFLQDLYRRTVYSRRSRTLRTTCIGRSTRSSTSSTRCASD